MTNPIHVKIMLVLAKRFGSVQDSPIANPDPTPALTQTLDLAQGRAGMSPETWIDPTFYTFNKNSLPDSSWSGLLVTCSKCLIAASAISTTLSTMKLPSVSETFMNVRLSVSIRLLHQNDIAP